METSSSLLSEGMLIVGEVTRRAEGEDDDAVALPPERLYVFFCDISEPEKSSATDEPFSFEGPSSFS